MLLYFVLRFNIKTLHLKNVTFAAVNIAKYCVGVLNNNDFRSESAFVIKHPLTNMKLPLINIQQGLKCFTQILKDGKLIKIKHPNMI